MLTAFACATIAVLIGGCAHFSPDSNVRDAWQRAEGEPKYMVPIDSALNQAVNGACDPKNSAVICKYYNEKNAASPDKDKLKRFRNIAMYEWLNEDDQDFQNYVLVFGFNERAASFGGDMVTLALASAATITHGEQAKTVLSGLAALATGTKVAFDKEIFFQNTYPALVKQMQQVRSDKRKEIEGKLQSSDDDSYPLPRAVSDLRDYEVLGTLTGVLATIGNATTPPSVDTTLDQWANGLTGMTIQVPAQGKTTFTAFTIKQATWNSGHSGLTITGTWGTGGTKPSDSDIKATLNTSAVQAGPDVAARFSAASVITKEAAPASQPTTNPTSNPSGG